MEKAQQTIRFHYLVPAFHFPDRNKLKSFLLKQLNKEGKRVEAINYIFCDDAYLLQINQQYLNHDTFTDIITFELSPKGQPLVADIYISIGRVRENASVFQTTFQKEFHRVIFHGMLHLVGYKDKTNAESKQMRVKEGEYLELYFVSRDTVSP
jgi:rRNA maturation RNase YbeY